MAESAKTINSGVTNVNNNNRHRHHYGGTNNQQQQQQHHKNRPHQIASTIMMVNRNHNNNHIHSRDNNDEKDHNDIDITTHDANNAADDGVVVNGASAAVGAVIDENPMKQCYENLIVIDAGANLTNKKYSRDLDSVVQRAKDAGVQKIMVPGTSVRSSKEALRLTRLYPGTIYSTAGIHPHDAKSIVEEPSSWFDLEAIAGAPECVAIGPCGLDYQRDFSEPEAQRDVFVKQVQLAIRLDKPVLLHERSAQTDCLEILDGFPKLPPIVVRGFMGTADEARIYLERGFYMGFTGYLCKDKSDTGVRKLLDDGAQLLPLDRLLVETDSPFMYPNTRASKLPAHVKNGISDRSMIFLQRYCTFQRNEPCSLPAIVEMIAAFMQKTPDEVALATAFNALKLFGLSQ